MLEQDPLASWMATRATIVVLKKVETFTEGNSGVTPVLNSDTFTE